MSIGDRIRAARPEVPAGPVSVSERLTAKSHRDPNGCLVWTGRIVFGGYGSMRVDGRERKTHVIAWEMVNGPVPAGLQLDHLCRNRACMEPTHLEAVTGRENTLRGEGITAQRARQTHCIHGHELAGANLIERPGRRECRACKDDRAARRDWSATWKRRTARAQTGGAS